jgi:hypothetical protein
MIYTQPLIGSKLNIFHHDSGVEFISVTLTDDGIMRIRVFRCRGCVEHDRCMVLNYALI